MNEESKQAQQARQRYGVALERAKDSLARVREAFEEWDRAAKRDGNAAQVEQFAPPEAFWGLNRWASATANKIT